MSPTNQHKVLAILTETITDRPTDWSDIMTAVSARMKIRNWLAVRGVLQYMINQGSVRRTGSVHVETYVR